MLVAVVVVVGFVGFLMAGAAPDGLVLGVVVAVGLVGFFVGADDAAGLALLFDLVLGAIARAVSCIRSEL